MHPGCFCKLFLRKAELKALPPHVSGEDGYKGALLRFDGHPPTVSLCILWFYIL